MASLTWNKCLLLVSFLLAVGTWSVVEGIRCYQCGTYITTSVTPCRNLSAGHLTECDEGAQFCSKYSNPAIQVYGCETKCEERVQNSFEIHCCDEDKCNSATEVRSSLLAVIGVLVAPLLQL